ncbi:DUF2141 domain-containing protein [Paucihalobacter sp.]|uniref:DUF2141 domain-containing protein n=1 Tax=Paucihalobacter sp. TaxID=2850405 RepID=UPI002FE3B7BA
MKLITTLTALLLLTFSGIAQEEQNKLTITVTVENAKNDNGKILIDLHTQETFLKGKGIESLESKVENGKATFTFKNVTPGEYALLVLHDENENYTMDFETNGMPKESYGTSNNPMSFGPPQFNEAKFSVADESLNLTIRF